MPCADCHKSEDVWQVYIWVCRFWGIVTAIGLWGVAVETTYRGHLLGLYLLFLAALMTFLETVFVYDFCVTAFVREENHRRFIHCWNLVLWFDTWKKGVLYLILSVGCFVEPNEVWLAVISGVMMVLASIFYFIKTIKVRREQIQEAERAKNRTYDRFDEIQDDIEDAGLGSISGTPIYTTSDTVAEQEEILEV